LWVKNSVSVTRERRIPSNPARVWEIIADPNMQERVDRRCRVESATGDWRSEGSEFVLVVRGVRMRYVVAEAVPGVRWVANVDRGGKPAAVQCGELRGDDAGTVLRWTVTVGAGALTRRLAERSCERELPRWLASVEREVLNSIR
jgi:uncharacterized protein YndB with AHSA1/START domain